MKPDVVFVQGDTTSAAASALCAFNKKIPVGHVEAGLRSFDLDAPYPEECNRRVISCFATYNFCPTRSARENLLSEAIPESRSYLTGNTIVDAMHRIINKNPLEDLHSIHPAIRDPFVLITAHRRESFGPGFENICTAIRECAAKFRDVQFVYPVHLNPNVQRPVQDLLKGLSNVFLLPPVSYLELLTLLKHSQFVLTDSGGIQEEAPTFGKYCIVMRDRTERMESVHMGLSELVGADRHRIVSAIERVMDRAHISFPPENPYGDGKASTRILDIVSQ
jgi:UDP-N-acetylglucosamine 2-epimerase (non-hydrolysing)